MDRFAGMFALKNPEEEPIITPMARGFSYRGTEDPSTQKAFLRPEKAFVGWVRAVPGGFGYRTSELVPWTYGSKLKIEAATCLLAIYEALAQAA